MAKLTHIREYGNQLVALFDDGSHAMAYPTSGGLWIVSGTNAPTDPVDPDPGGGDIYNPWSGYTVSGTWEDHASYSQGGLDYPLAYGTPLLAPAAGVYSYDGHIGSAGRRGRLTLTTPATRTKPKSNTIMNGGISEAPGPMTAIIFQHMSTEGTPGPKAKGDVCALSGASANGSDYGGDVHLHVHGEAANGDRLDFWKFV